MHLLGVQQATARGDGDADQQGGDHRIAREQPAPGQPGGEHCQREHQLGVHGDEHVQPEAQQHTGQHAGGQRHRYPLHQSREDRKPASRPSTAASRNAPVASESEAPPAPPPASPHPGRPRCHHRHPIAQRQANAGHAHAQPQRPHPGGDLRLVGTDGLCAWNTITAELAKPPAP
jgi:hypothetical protein